VSERLVISSVHNPRVREAAALRERRERERSGRVLVEGARESARALAAGWEADAAFVCRELLSGPAREVLAPLSTRRGIAEVTPHVFEKLALREGSDGLVVVLVRRERTLVEALGGDRSLVVALHGVEKPGNLGAIVRTADGVGATGVVLLEGSGDPLSPNAIRASLGTVFSLPVAGASSDELIELGRRLGVRFFAAALGEGARPPWAHDLRGPTCLVLGAEASGLPERWLAVAERVQIPMRGVADSLNVGVAGAMLLYEALRQRQGA
jgi:TrmH family RNA methyltransferase